MKRKLQGKHIFILKQLFATFELSSNRCGKSYRKYVKTNEFSAIMKIGQITK